MSDTIQKNTSNSILEEDVAINIVPSKRTIVSIALLLAAFGCNFSLRAFGLALPHIIANWDAMELYTVGSSLMTVAMTVTTIVVSRISPKLGLKITISFGLILLLVCNVLTLVAPNMLIFVILRVLTGVGNGTILGQLHASFSKIWPSVKRSTWIGILGLVQSFISVIGPTISGLLIDNYGWQSTYYVISALQLVGFIIFFIVTPNDTRDRFYKPTPFDAMGTIFFGTLITSIVLVGSFANSLGWGSPQILLGIAAIIVSFILLIIFENKAGDAAVLPWNLFMGNRNFQKIFALTFFTTVLCVSQTYFMPLYMQKVAGTSATVSGIPFTMLSIGSLIASPVAARIFKKTGKSKPIIICTCFLMLVPLLFYALWFSPEIGQSQTSLMVIYATSLIYGFGYILSMTVPYNACSEYLPVESVGIASANVYMSVTMGASIGMAVLQAVMNKIASTVDLNTALKSVYLCSCAAGVITILLAATLKHSSKDAVKKA